MALTTCSPDTGCYDDRDSHSNCWSLTDFYRAIYARSVVRLKLKGSIWAANGSQAE
jgi:hypothetical protein